MTKEKISLLQAEHDDLQDLLRLVLATYAHYRGRQETPPDARAVRARLAKYLNRNPGYRALLARNGDGLAVGYAMYASVFWTSECDVAMLLKEIFVLGEYRNRGIGAALMRRLAATAEQQGVCRIVWAVDRNNGAAARFYKRLPGAQEQHKTLYTVDGARLARLARPVVRPATSGLRLGLRRPLSPSL